MADPKRIVIPLMQAIDLLEVSDKGKVLTFHQVGEQRVHAEWDRTDLIEAMAYYSQTFGGVELSGEIARHHHYGLTIHRGDIVKQLPQRLAGRMPLGWLFIRTKEGKCCHCSGSGKTARERFQIIASKCSTCEGTGTYPKAKDNPFAEELRRMGQEKKGGKK